MRNRNPQALCAEFLSLTHHLFCLFSFLFCSLLFNLQLTDQLVFFAFINYFFLCKTVGVYLIYKHIYVFLYLILSIGLFFSILFLNTTFKKAGNCPEKHFFYFLGIFFNIFALLYLSCTFLIGVDFFYLIFLFIYAK